MHGHLNTCTIPPTPHPLLPHQVHFVLVIYSWAWGLSWVWSLYHISHHYPSLSQHWSNDKSSLTIDAISYLLSLLRASISSGFSLRRSYAGCHNHYDCFSIPTVHAGNSPFQLYEYEPVGMKLAVDYQVDVSLHVLWLKYALSLSMGSYWQVLAVTKMTGNVWGCLRICNVWGHLWEPMGQKSKKGKSFLMLGFYWVVFGV